MKVRMTRDHQMSPDGVTVSTLGDGQEYDLPEATAARLVERGAALEAKAKVAPPENKAEAAAPENKAAKPRRTRKPAA